MPSQRTRTLLNTQEAHTLGLKGELEPRGYSLTLTLNSGKGYSPKISKLP